MKWHVKQAQLPQAASDVDAAEPRSTYRLQLLSVCPTASYESSCTVEINDKNQLCREEESFDLSHKSVFCGDITLDGTLMFYPSTTM